jgi:hypothetical protein
MSDTAVFHAKRNKSAGDVNKKKPYRLSLFFCVHTLRSYPEYSLDPQADHSNLLAKV